MKKKLPEIFGRYEIKFLPLHPLSKSKQRWLTLFLEHFYKTLIDKCVEEHVFLRRVESLAKGTHYNICACARKETTEG